jgi:hypothetical protein
MSQIIFLRFCLAESPLPAIPTGVRRNFSLAIICLDSPRCCERPKSIRNHWGCQPRNKAKEFHVFKRSFTPFYHNRNDQESISAKWNNRTRLKGILRTQLFQPPNPSKR